MLKILKNMVGTNFFDDNIYEIYCNEHITKVDNELYKMSRKELLDDFLIWIKINNITSNADIYCNTHLSNVFKDVFVMKIQKFSKCRYDNERSKVKQLGVFLNMTHKNFELNKFLSYKKINKEKKSGIEKHIDKWMNKENQSDLAKIFRKMVETNYTITNIEIRELLQKKTHRNLMRHKNEQLIFEKTCDGYKIKEEIIKLLN